MRCRAPTSAGTQTGAQLSYDNESQLSAWQNAPTSPTSADSFLYDGEGHRVEQQRTPSGQATATTRYILGGLEEDTGQITKYFSVAGLPSAERVGTSGTLSYLTSDRLGSVSEAMDGSGNVTAAQLYAPYGGAFVPSRSAHALFPLCLL